METTTVEKQLVKLREDIWEKMKETDSFDGNLFAIHTRLNGTLELMNLTKNFKEQAEQHWKWVKGLLDVAISEQFEYEEMVGLCRYLYTTAMIHGYKHGREGCSEVE